MVEAVRSTPNSPHRYAAIIFPTYGIFEHRRRDPLHPEKTLVSNRMTYFSGNNTRATSELIKEGVAPMAVIKGAQIYPGDSINDGDYINPFMVRLGVNEGAVVQRRDSRHTYDQMSDARDAIRELEIDGKVLVVHEHLHRWRVPALVKKYGINADTAIAEDILGERYPAFKKSWRRIRWQWSYIKTELLELGLRLLMVFDTPDDAFARRLSARRFAKHGADVPNLQRGKVVRSY